uniref:CCHC-type domain-containing protein n=1 Tax=Macrostomum lignano TaxID=282301 RepID=A0A1I8HSL5_9PLAT
SSSSWSAAACRIAQIRCLVFGPAAAAADLTVGTFAAADGTFAAAAAAPPDEAAVDSAAARGENLVRTNSGRQQPAAGAGADAAAKVVGASPSDVGAAGSLKRESSSRHLPAESNVRGLAEPRLRAHRRRQRMSLVLIIFLIGWRRQSLGAVDRRLRVGRLDARGQLVAAAGSVHVGGRGHRRHLAVRIVAGAALLELRLAGLVLRHVLSLRLRHVLRHRCAAAATAFVATWRSGREDLRVAHHLTGSAWRRQVAESLLRFVCAVQAFAQDLDLHGEGRHPKQHLKQRHPKQHLKQRHPKQHLKQCHPKQHHKQCHPKQHLKQRHPKQHHKQRHPKQHLKQRHPKQHHKQRHPKQHHKQRHPKQHHKQRHPKQHLKQRHPKQHLKQCHPKQHHKQRPSSSVAAGKHHRRTGTMRRLPSMRYRNLVIFCSHRANQLDELRHIRGIRTLETVSPERQVGFLAISNLARFTLVAAMDSTHTSENNAALLPPKFSGQSNVHKWLSVFEDFVEDKGWDDAQSASKLKLLLHGEAQICVWDLPEADRKSYKKIKEVLQKQFGGAASQHRAMEEFQDRRRNSAETLRELSYSLRLLYMTARPDDSSALRDREVKFRIIQLMTADIRDTLLKDRDLDSCTLEELVERATRLEQIASKCKPGNSPAVAMVDDRLARLEQQLETLTAAVTRGGSARGRGGGRPRDQQQRSSGCFRCGKEGHIARRCPAGGSQGQGRCFNCSGWGHGAAVCPSKARPSSVRMVTGTLVARVESKTSVPARSEKLVWLRVKSEDEQGIFEPDANFTQATGLLVSRVLTVSADQKIPVRVCNLGSEEVLLYANKAVGSFEAADLINNSAGTVKQSDCWDVNPDLDAADRQRLLALLKANGDLFSTHEYDLGSTALLKHLGRLSPNWQIAMTTWQSSSETAFCRMSSRPIDSKLPKASDGFTDALDFAEATQRRLLDSRARVHQQLQASQTERNERYNMETRFRPYKEGDLVMLSCKVVKPGRSKSLSNRWTRPYIILKRLGEVNYRVRPASGPGVRMRRRQVVHHDRLKPFVERRNSLRPGDDLQATADETADGLVDPQLQAPDAWVQLFDGNGGPDETVTETNQQEAQLPRRSARERRPPDFYRPIKCKPGNSPAVAMVDDRLARLEQQLETLTAAVTRGGSARGRGGGRPRDQQQRSSGCFRCGKEGHIARRCPAGGSQGQGRCFNCSGWGHGAAVCPSKARPSSVRMVTGTLVARVESKTSVPARSEKLVWLRVKSEDEQGIFEPDANFTQATGLLVSRVLTVSADQKIPVRVCNLGSEEVLLYANKAVGSFEAADLINNSAGTVKQTDCWDVNPDLDAADRQRLLALLKANGDLFSTHEYDLGSTALLKHLGRLSPNWQIAMTTWQSSSETAFCRMSSRPIDSKLPKASDGFTDALDFAEATQRRLLDSRARVHQQLQASQTERNERYNMETRFRPYKEGDLVMLSCKVVKPGRSKSLSNRWTRPYIILKRLGEVNYRVRPASGPGVRMRRRQVVHHDRLKPFVERRNSLRPGDDLQATADETADGLVDPQLQAPDAWVQLFDGNGGPDETVTETNQQEAQLPRRSARERRPPDFYRPILEVFIELNARDLMAAMATPEDTMRWIAKVGLISNQGAGHFCAGLAALCSELGTVRWSPLQSSTMPQPQQRPPKQQQQRSLPISEQHQRPSGRWKQACVLHNGWLYVHGGRCGRQPLKDLWRWRESAGWRRVHLSGATPPPLEGHTMVASRGHLYIFGGTYGGYPDCPLWIVSPQFGLSRQWEASSRDLVQIGSRRCHSAVLHRGAMCVFGGIADTRGSCSELWLLDLATESWHLAWSPVTHRGPGPAARYGHSACAYDGGMYIYGGLAGLSHCPAELWR